MVLLSIQLRFAIDGLVEDLVAACRAYDCWWFRYTEIMPIGYKMQFTNLYVTMDSLLLDLLVWLTCQSEIFSEGFSPDLQTYASNKTNCPTKGSSFSNDNVSIVKLKWQPFDLQDFGSFLTRNGSPLLKHILEDFGRFRKISGDALKC